MVLEALGSHEMPALFQASCSTAHQHQRSANSSARRQQTWTIAPTSAKAERYSYRLLSVHQRAGKTWIPTAQDHECSARSRQIENKSWFQWEEHYMMKACSCCGRLNCSITSNKVFSCSNCSLTLDRDVNAAQNICLKNEHLLTWSPGVRVPGDAHSAVVRCA